VLNNTICILLYLLVVGIFVFLPIVFFILSKTEQDALE